MTNGNTAFKSRVDKPFFIESVMMSRLENGSRTPIGSESEGKSPPFRPSSNHLPSRRRFARAPPRRRAAGNARSSRNSHPVVRTPSPAADRRSIRRLRIACAKVHADNDLPIARFAAAVARREGAQRSASQHRNAHDIHRHALSLMNSASAYPIEETICDQFA